jgi:hypothetical protein
MPNVSRNVGGTVIIRESYPPAWATISRNKDVAMEDPCRIERGVVRPFTTTGFSRSCRDVVCYATSGSSSSVRLAPCRIWPAR